MAADNKSLGKFILDGIPPAPRGVPQIEVTFDIDANGILKVTARDKATGRSQNITITASSGLSEVEVERMRKEAEAHAEEDRKRKELIEARNRADNTLYTAEKALKEFGEKIPAEVKTQVEEEIAKTKKALEGDDIERIRKATDALGEIIQKIGASAYEQPSAAAGSPPPGDSDDDVIDGEVEDAS